VDYRADDGAGSVAQCVADNDRRQIAAINAMVASNEAREAQAERERRENDPNLN